MFSDVDPLALMQNTQHAEEGAEGVANQWLTK